MPRIVTSPKPRVPASKPASKPAPARQPDPGPLEPVRFPATYDTFGQARFRSANRYVVPDDQLIKVVRGKKVLGDAVSWKAAAGVSNFFWDSLDNRSDPALLRMQARFLELSAGVKTPSVATARAELLEQVRERLTSGDEDRGLRQNELLFFPPALAVDAVKRLAAAARVPIAEVLVYDGRSNDLTLTQWASRANLRVVDYRELHESRTPAAREELADLQRRAAQMTAWFEVHPHASIADYSAEMEAEARYREAHPEDAAFWAAMQDMMDKADVADLAGPGLGGLGLPRPGRGPRPAPARQPEAPPPPSRPPPPSSQPAPMTSWEMLRHPRFADYLVATREGYGGGFAQFIRTR